MTSSGSKRVRTNRREGAECAPSRTLVSHFLVAIVIFVGLSCHAGKARLASEIRNLTEGPLDSCTTAIWRLHAEGKDAIPELIGAIGSNTGWIPLLRDPTSSHGMVAGELESRSGVTAAYVIELILARDSLVGSGNPPEKPPAVIATLGFSQRNYIFARGVIRHIGHERSLTDAEMKEVQELYQEWWQKNKEKTLDELRDGWKAGRRPLSGSEYRWL